MASLFLSSEEMQGIHGLSGRIDEKLIEIISSRDNKNPANLSKQIIANFTKSTLLESRRKIYEFAIEKEKGNRSLATDANDAIVNDPDDRARIDMQDMSKWQLTNRGTKPKITDGIIQLSLFIDVPGESFPIRVLATNASKPKPKSDSNTGNGVVEIPDNNSDKGKVNPEAAQKEFERSVIREVCGGDTSGTTPNCTPVTVTKLIESSASTREHSSTRSFATQTDESSFDCSVCNARLAIGRESTSNTPDYVPRTENCTIPVPSPTRSDTVRTPDRPSKASSNREVSLIESSESKTNSTISSHSDTSLLEYIDSEYESLKNMNKAKRSDSRTSKVKYDYEKRLSDLESKYETVVKRLTFVEKDHTREICELKAEQRRITYFGLVNDGSSSPERKRLRRHSSGDFEKSGTPSTQAKESSTTDDSVWDANYGDIIVDTQDSQGNSVSTRATPLHLREMRQAGKQPCSSADVSASNGSIQPRPKPSSSRRPDGNDFRQFFDGMEDIPPASTPVAPDDRDIMLGGNLEDECNDGRGVQPPKKQQMNKRNAGPKQKPAPSKGNPANMNSANNARPSSIEKGPRHSSTKMNPQQASTSGQSTRPAVGGATANCNSANVAICDKGNSVNVTGDKLDKDPYSIVVTRNGWDKSGNGNKSKGKKKPFLPISGLVDSETKEMFVKGLKCAGFRSRKELEDSIKAYVEEKGIFMIHHRVLAFKTDRTTVRCKIVIGNEDIEKITSKGFWPPGIWIREWFDDPLPSEEEQNSRNDRSSGSESN